MDTPVRWGVLGAARIARQQVIPAIRRAGAGEVLAVSSASGGAREYAAELDIPRAYGSHEELLADPDVEAVYLPLPNARHREWVVRAAQAGKHVLCEKPLVLRSADLDEVDEACAAAGVQLAEAFMYRHHPQVRRVRELIADGAVGEVVALTGRFHFALQRSSEPDIRLLPELGGGALLDVGCYPVDLFGLLLGETPREVAAVARRDRADGVGTRVAAVLGYERVVATLDCSFDAAAGNTATVMGSRGTLTLTDAFRADVPGLGRIVLDRDGEDSVVEEVPGDQYGEEVRAFARRVRTGEPDAEGAAATRRTVEVLERIGRAAGLV
ncbi:Gfo/Idh/MocA family oxidoreductase [Georgenia sp. 10Sc9-8]|uniref:Gfo/Idh/MocA family oxidoreductase n=1 Tax=Georgenia halotolerans TaxID=3028317 RepID=A0ABT5TVE9_9MICO|nr:Gfo/Idh/MocA family oxidoreductase [Georgenia halotolerans]